jgi:hypothetical protein
MLCVKKNKSIRKGGCSESNPKSFFPSLVSKTHEWKIKVECVHKKLYASVEAAEVEAN